MNLRTLTIPQAAKETGISADSLRRLFDAGSIAGNKVGHVRRISVASLEAWITRTPEPVKVNTSRSFPEAGEDRFA